MITKNALIESVSLNVCDFGMLTAWLYLDYGDALHQGFGGHVLSRNTKELNHYACGDFTGLFICRVMQVAGVEKWEDVKGRHIRVMLDKDGLGADIMGIQHIIDDRVCFFPRTDFDALQKITKNSCSEEQADKN